MFDPVAFREPVLALLDAIANLTTYDGEVPATPPLDPDGRVHPYAVLYSGPGSNVRNTLDATSTLKPWGFQVTCVGGDPQRTLWAVAAVTGALVDARLTVAGWTSSPIEHIPGPDLARDDVPIPPRHYVPLLFSLVATPA